jgi:hypothetical protein
MGSYSTIEFDSCSVTSAKSHVPDSFISLFQESDRIVKLDSSDPDYPFKRISYSVPRELMLERFDVLGVTAEAARYAFESWLDDEKQMYAEMAKEDNAWTKELETLNVLTYSEWQRRVPSVLKNRYRHNYKPVDAIDRQMCELQDNWLFFEIDGDERLILRALLDACAHAKKVHLDITDLVLGGYISEDFKICRDGSNTKYAMRPLLEPVVILAEGSSDIRILKQSLTALFPHLKEFFSFFEHEGLNIDGGANYLIKFLKAFSAARISTRIVALFDNDTAGIEAYSQAKKFSFPQNIKILHLPDIALAKSYPSIGPQGDHLINANGRAASIELYLGQRNITQKDGKLIPIRWGGYNERMKAYHGEIANKTDVIRSFERDIVKKRSVSKAQKDFPELVSIWQMIFNAIKNSDVIRN